MTSTVLQRLDANELAAAARGDYEVAATLRDTAEQVRMNLPGGAAAALVGRPTAAAPPPVPPNGSGGGMDRGGGAPPPQGVYWAGGRRYPCAPTAEALAAAAASADWRHPTKVGPSKMMAWHTKISLDNH